MTAEEQEVFDAYDAADRERTRLRMALSALEGLASPGLMAAILTELVVAEAAYQDVTRKAARLADLRGRIATV